MSRRTFLAAVSLAACTGTRESPTGRDDQVDAGPQVADAGPRVDATPARCFEPTIDADVALTVQIEESCAIWNSLDLLAGVATIARDGDTLTIDFGDGVVFTGTVAETVVSLAYVHPHDFTDGCGWQATESLAGQLDEATCLLSFDYQYVEAVVVDNGGCASPCSANADVTLELTPVDVE